MLDECIKHKRDKYLVAKIQPGYITCKTLTAAYFTKGMRRSAKRFKVHSY